MKFGLLYNLTTRFHLYWRLEYSEKIHFPLTPLSYNYYYRIYLHFVIVNIQEIPLYSHYIPFYFGPQNFSVPLVNYFSNIVKRR